MYINFMKYITIIFVLLNFQCYSQITGNLHVKDTNAIKLDTKVLKKFVGKWKFTKSQEIFHEEEQIKKREIIIDFDLGGELSTSLCVGCYEEKSGFWRIHNDNLVTISGSQTFNNKYFKGEWHLYKLNKDEMVLAKVLTSSGSWKKMLFFSRDIGKPITNKIDRYCMNCNENNTWCWGDRPEEAKRYWSVLNDLTSNEKDIEVNSMKILKKIDWLLINAPCINLLYDISIKFYRRLLNEEKNEHTILLYQEKIKQIERQQLKYFNP